MMFRYLIFTLSASLLASFAVGQNDNLDMFGLINVLYLKVDINMDMQVTEAEFERIWNTMDRNNDSKITEPEFIDLWKRFTGFGDEMNDAYFRLSDVDRNGEIDRMDNDRVYQVFDLNGDGMVTSVEFDDEYQKIYHRIPFVILFERTDKANDNKQRLTKPELGQLFSSLTTTSDGSLTKAMMEQGWTANRFGTAKDADAVFDSLDADKDGTLTQAEVAARFDDLEKSGDGLIEITEIEFMGDVVPIV